MPTFVTSCLIGSSWNFLSDYIKNVDVYDVNFNSKKTSNKKVISEKPLTNLYENEQYFICLTKKVIAKKHLTNLYEMNSRARLDAARNALFDLNRVAPSNAINRMIKFDDIAKLLIVNFHYRQFSAKHIQRVTFVTIIHCK